MCARKYNFTCALIYLISSVFSLVLGLIIVLIIMRQTVVPVLNAKAVHITQCVIQQLLFHISNTSVNTSFTSFNHNWNSTSFNYTKLLVEEQLVCVMVKVEYREPGHGMKSGFLFKSISWGQHYLTDKVGI